MARLQIEFFSNCLRRTVQFKMVIPGDHDNSWEPEQKRKGEPLKTIFLLHGYTGSAGNWIPEDLLIKYNIAVVAPSGENGFWIDGPATGHAYASFLCEELVEFVRRTFHLAQTREDTFVMGFSMGGFGALHSALAYPETFSKAIALSSAYIIPTLETFEPGQMCEVANYEYYRECFGDLKQAKYSRNNPEVLVQEILREGKQMPDLYMACGTEDFLLERNRIFHHFLEEQGVDHVYMESEGNHDMTFWNQYARILIPKLFE